MESLLVAAAVLACPVGMGVMMWFLGRGMKQRRGERPAVRSSVSVDDLRTEQARLTEEIERLERENPQSQPQAGARVRS